ncbi:UNVERIFIED_CONTAM: hypothetical protein HDU68_010901 [Siphonaria sp. JEL0065]|nr:hypothetical protein HDU68_010901 [Siphonaria sp. JEL0065]
MTGRPLTARLWEVLVSFLPLSFLTFGGPQASIAILLDTFVTKKGWLSEQVFTELFAITNALPGPPSVQLVFTIGLLRGGVANAVFAFVTYCLPGGIIMAFLGFGVSRLGTTSALPLYVLYIERSLAAVAIALIAIAAKQLSSKLLLDKTCCTIATIAIVLVINFTSTAWLIPVLMIFSGLATFLEADVPVWIEKWQASRKLKDVEAPMQLEPTEEVIVAGATLTNDSSNETTETIDHTIIAPRTPTPATQEKDSHEYFSYSVKTGFFLLGLTAVLIVACVILRSHEINQPINIFSIFFFVGALIFGGGPVVVPLLYTYLVSGSAWLTSAEFLMGFAIINIMPGPNYNFAAYCGVLAFRDNGWTMLVGALLAWVAIFTPGLLITAGTLPIWRNYREMSAMKKVFKGLNSAAVGLLIAAVYILWMKAIALPSNKVVSLGEYTGWTGVMAVAFLLLDVHRIQPWWVVGGGAIVGILTWVAEGKPIKEAENALVVDDWIKTKLFENALETLSRHVHVCPLKVDWRLKRADIYHEMNDNVMAIGDLSQVAGIKPTPEILHRLASLRLKQGELPDALASIKECMKRIPKTSHAKKSLGVLKLWASPSKMVQFIKMDQEEAFQAVNTKQNFFLPNFKTPPCMLGQQKPKLVELEDMLRDEPIDDVSQRALRKRNRDVLEQDDEVDDINLHLELNKDQDLPSIHSLKNEYLSVARTISQERVRKVLFIDCDEEDLSVPPTPRMQNATIPNHPWSNSAMDTAKDPLILSTNLLSESSVRINLPTRILALNNTSENRLPGATTPIPAESTIKLLRSILIMIESESRQILHYSLDFLRKICDCAKSKANITTTAREIAKVFGPIFVGLNTLESRSVTATPNRTASVAWAETFCELLIYAHGLPTTASTNVVKPVVSSQHGTGGLAPARKILTRKKSSLLWKIPSGLQDAINERANAQKTPSRRSVMSVNVTPSRRAIGNSVSRITGMAGQGGGGGGSSRRILFGSPKGLQACLLPPFIDDVKTHFFMDISVGPKTVAAELGSSSQHLPNSPTKFLFTGGSASQFTNSMVGPSFAFGNGVEVGNATGTLFLSSANQTASTDRNAFAKRLRIE